MTDPMTTTSAAPALAETWREVDDLVASLSSSSASPSTRWRSGGHRPSGLPVRAHAVRMVDTAVDKPCPARHYPRRAPAGVPRGGGQYPAVHLGVTTFGQAGDLDSVYRHHGLDADTIVRAMLDTVHR